MFKRLVMRMLNIKMNIIILIAFLLYWSMSHYRSGRSAGDREVVLIWWTRGFPGTSQHKRCKGRYECRVLSERDSGDASAYLFYGSNIDFDDLPLPRAADAIWALYHEESPRNVAELSHEPVLRLFNYSSTFSRRSDVPCTLQYLESLDHITSREFFVETADKNEYLKELSPVLYIQSDCDTSTERDDYVRELMKHIKVDSYGACLNNKRLPRRFRRDYLNNLNDGDFLRFVARYKFVIAIENGVCDDYITEKLWRAIRVGSVPIYYGAPNVRDWLPNDASVVSLRDYGSVAELVARIDTLLDDDLLYDEHLRHKTEGRIDNERLLRAYRENPSSADASDATARLECLVCERIHERMAGRDARPRTLDVEHYKCPKPTSALTQGVNPNNEWVQAWEIAEQDARRIYTRITQTMR